MALDHKTWCNCRLCFAAKELEETLKTKRTLPPFVKWKLREQMLKKEEEMLSLGYILMVCPNCQHRTFTKITPEMKCICCGTVFK
jgi:ribosomal protein S27E